MIGQSISHYKILEKLGEGGMGIVYKAEDTKLKRTVALKFLKPQSLGSVEDKTRFLHEAQAAAALDHPNICTIYAIEETEGQSFIVMAYLEGESLKEKIQKGPLKIDEALDITIQIADGLHQAHQKGIIHRDIKSGNIMITALGLVKIMDFGLARLVGRTTITETGATLGTPGYMSPEQARGDKVDHRTDIWSLGVVIYEMITGRLPFRGDYQEAVIYSILNEQPEPPTSLRTGVPMELEKIVSKAMAKKADERYQHLDELLVDVKRLKKDTEQKVPTQQIPARGKEYRKLSAIMFSDIVAYSRIMQQDEDLAMDLLARHNQLVRDAIKKHNGTEIKVIGDAFLVDFETVATAVRCAIEIQETISKYNADKPESQRILLRIGIHVGDVIVKGNDVFGDGVNIASRIEPLAEPGGICISQEVYNMVKHKLDVEVVSLGPKELKNIKDKIEIYEILVGSIAGKELATAGRRIVARGTPFHKRVSTWIAAGIVLIGVVLGLYVFKSKTPETSSQMVSRVLKVPNYKVKDPNISPDGNWVVYVTRAVRSIDNLYIQHVSSGEPKRITNDTASSFKSNPCFSPDASEILYNQNDSYFDSAKSKTPFISNIYKVSTLGGSPRKVISDGQLPMWSPEGNSIAFLRFDGDKPTIWVANADGSSEKEIVRDSLPSGIYRYSISWSPDGKRIAHLHNFATESNESYSEIFTCDITTGGEKQVTSDKKIIGDICWAATDEIVFSLIQGKNENLWTVPTSGGSPKQLTSQAGTNILPHISKDAKRLVYLSESSSTNLWTAELTTKELKQLTFEDGGLLAPKFSPQGNKIMCTQADVDQIYICNVDGGEPVQVTHSQGVRPNAYQWSGDGKAIAYSVSQRDTIPTKPGSVHYTNSIFIQDLERETPQIVGKGILVDWSPDRKYMLYRSNQETNNQKYILALTASIDKPIKQIESVGDPSFSHDSRNVIYTDSNYLWTLSLEDNQTKRLRKCPKGLYGTFETSDGKSIFAAMSEDRSVFYKFSNFAAENKWVFYKFSKVGSVIERLFEMDGRLLGFSISPDMKTVVLSCFEIRNKIVVIDNFR